MSFGVSINKENGEVMLSNINTILRNVAEFEYAIEETRVDSVSPFNNPVAALEIAPIGKQSTSTSGRDYYAFGYAGNCSIVYSEISETISYSQSLSGSSYIEITPQAVALYSYV